MRHHAPEERGTVTLICDWMESAVMALPPASGEERRSIVSDVVLCGLPGLVYGDAYEIEARVGDRYRWSTWSKTSESCRIFVEPPRIQDKYDVNVEVDGQAAKVDWPHAQTAEGLTEVEYELTFIQCLQNSDELDRHVMHLEIVPRP